MRRCQKLPPCQTESVPAGSKTDLPVAKTEPISNTGSSSVLTCLRRGENCCAMAARREERAYVREITLQTARSVKKEVEEVLQELEQRFPCSPW